MLQSERPLGGELELTRRGKGVGRASHLPALRPRLPKNTNTPGAWLAQTRVHATERATTSSTAGPSHDPGLSDSAMIRPDCLFSAGSWTNTCSSTGHRRPWLRSTTTAAHKPATYAPKPAYLAHSQHYGTGISDLGQRQPIEGMMTMASTTSCLTQGAKPPSDHPSSTSSHSPSVKSERLSAFLAFGRRFASHVAPNCTIPPPPPLTRKRHHQPQHLLSRC